MRAADRHAKRIAAVQKVVAEMQDPDCPCRSLIASIAGSALVTPLQHFIRTQYRHVAEALLRELRIFTGANALVFGLLFAVAYARRGAGLQLLFPAVILAGASASPWPSSPTWC
jgi:hypothetical protein